MQNAAPTAFRVIGRVYWHAVRLRCYKTLAEARNDWDANALENY